MAKNTQQTAAKPAATQNANIPTDPNVTAPEETVVAPKQKNTPKQKPHYQEWEVKIMNGKVEKLKVSREKVNISEDEANILNEGISKGSNTYAKMYFLSE